jgi:imidazolonepropionase-like amidohydrolase
MLTLLLACASRPLAEAPPIDSAADTAPADTRAPHPPAIVVGAGCVPPGSVGAHFVLAGGTVVGVGPADVEIDGGRIVAVGTAAAGVPTVDVSGAFLTPAVIDSHVHLAYLPEGDALAAGGVAAVVDLASPTSFLAADHAPLRFLGAGPMITAPGGYPTQGWGRGGYGIECADADAAVAAVDTLHGLGVGVVKLPVTSAPVLDAEALAAAAARAHSYGLPVATHALFDADASAAATAGADVLAHTPVEALSDATIAAWRGRAVISTLGAFGGSSAAVANLAALHDAGLTVLYGTDFGNSRTAGIDGDELALLGRAGLTPAEVLAAATSAPATFWGFTDLGSITPGKAASLLVLRADPLVDPTALAAPSAVYLDGVRMGER